MKKVLFGLSLMLLTIAGMSVNAQNILSPDDENNLSNFYTLSQPARERCYLGNLHVERY